MRRRTAAVLTRTTLAVAIVTRDPDLDLRSTAGPVRLRPAVRRCRRRASADPSRHRGLQRRRGPLPLHHRSRASRHGDAHPPRSASSPTSWPTSILVPIYGILGAAAASSISYIATACSRSLSSTRVSGRGLVETLVIRRSDLVAAVAAGAAMSRRLRRRVAPAPEPLVGGAWRRAGRRAHHRRARAGRGDLGVGRRHGHPAAGRRRQPARPLGRARPPGERDVPAVPRGRPRPARKPGRVEITSPCRCATRWRRRRRCRSTRGSASSARHRSTASPGTCATMPRRDRREPPRSSAADRQGRPRLAEGPRVECRRSPPDRATDRACRGSSGSPAAPAMWPRPLPRTSSTGIGARASAPPTTSLGRAASSGPQRIVTGRGHRRRRRDRRQPRRSVGGPRRRSGGRRQPPIRLAWAGRLRRRQGPGDAAGGARGAARG